MSKTTPTALKFLLAGALAFCGLPPAAQALQISPSTKVTAKPGDVINFTAAASITQNNQAPLSTHSNDPLVASIDASGSMRALTPGRAVISIRRGDEYATVSVTVKRELPPEAMGKFSSDAAAEAPAHPIDAVVVKNMRSLGVAPSPLCTDAEYFRRVCIDLMGALPSADVARRFLEDDSPGKREKLLDWIFAQNEYADFWAMKWCDVLRVKSEFPSNLWPNAVQAYHGWLRAAMASNMSYDKMARALLLTSGSNFRDPPANFYRAMQKRSAAGIASSFALIFMGARLDCAECKEHPYKTWTHEQAEGLAAFFTDVRYKKTDEWKEEIVYFRNWSPYRVDGETIPPVYPDGGKAEWSRTANPRRLIANWLTKPGNPYFARHVANRYWSALFGRGITMPVDDVRPGNPPCNSELLDLLAQKVTDSGFDLRALLRFIVTSQTYQRSSVANEWNRDDTQNWSHYIPRRLDAEVLADAIGRATGVYESFTSRIPEPFAMWPGDFHSVQNPDSSVTSGFLETFGRPGRDTSYEYERDRNPSMAQALYMLDSDAFSKKLEKRDGVIGEMVRKHGKNHGAFCDEYYLMLLARKPNDAERQRVTDYIARTQNKNRAAQDVVWALLNTKEFLYNH